MFIYGHRVIAQSDYLIIKKGDTGTVLSEVITPIIDVVFVDWDISRIGMHEFNSTRPINYEKCRKGHGYAVPRYKIELIKERNKKMKKFFRKIKDNWNWMTFWITFGLIFVSEFLFVLFWIIKIVLANPN